MKIRLLAAGGFLAAAFGIGAAVAQLTSPTGTGGPLLSTDVVALGRPGPGTTYATIGQVGGMRAVSLQVPITGFSITVPHGISDLILQPAGTLATGTITLDATPNDGQSFCWVSTATQTAITITAGTGQTLSGAATETAGVANTPNCRTYVASNSTWYHSVAGSP
jgi:hypothetical protein